MLLDFIPQRDNKMKFDLNWLKARSKENSTYLGAALVAYVGGLYGPEMVGLATQVMVLVAGVTTMVRGDK